VHVLEHGFMLLGSGHEVGRKRLAGKVHARYFEGSRLHRLDYLDGDRSHSLPTFFMASAMMLPMLSVLALM